MDFVIAGVAAVCAGTITNPLDVIKLRLQMQGELKAKGTHPVTYKNFIHTGYLIVKHEGVFSLQKGITAAAALQLANNGLRLGKYL